MKKVFTAIIFISIAYIFAYYNEGKPKGYEFLPFDFDIFSSKTKTEKIDEYIKEGKLAYADSNFYEAEKLFKKVIKKDRDNTLAKYWLAKTYFQQEIYYSAEDYFNEVIEATDTLDSAYFFLAQCLYKDEYYDEAFYNISEFLYQNPQSSEGFDLFAYINYYVTDNPDSSIIYEKSAILFDSSNTNAYYGLNFFYKKKAKTFFIDDSVEKYYQLGINTLLQLLTIKPDIPIAFKELGENYYSLENNDSTIYFLKKYFGIKYIVDDSTRIILAKAYYNKKDYKNSKEQLDTALTTIFDPESFYLRGMCNVMLEDYEEAAPNFYQAYLNGKDNYRAEQYLLLSAKYYTEVNREKSIEYLKTYLDTYHNKYGREDSVTNVLKLFGITYIPEEIVENTENTENYNQQDVNAENKNVTTTNTNTTNTDNINVDVEK